MDKSTELIDAVKSLLPDKHVERVASESGFVRRLRKIKPVPFLWTLVLGFGVGGERDISSFRRVYERLAGVTLVPSAFYDRFTRSTVKFLRNLLATAMEELATAWYPIDERLQAFTDVVITDATLVKLNDRLAKVFPGPRTNTSPAAAKLHFVVSVTGKGNSTVRLSEGKVHDQRKFQVGPWVCDRLLMFDLGYYRFQLFSCIERNGGYFLTRLKDNANPRILEVFDCSRGPADPLVGRSLQPVLGTLRREVLDANVELEFGKRSYRGSRTRSRQGFRMVAIRDQDSGKYHCYLTNVPRDLLSAEEIVKTYRCRWEIELLFKELKSGYRLDQVKSTKPEIVEAMFYAAFLTLIVSRRILAVLAPLVTRGAERVTAGRWWKLFAYYAQEILLVVVRPRRTLHALLPGLIETLLHELVDPHTRRRPMLRELRNYAGS